MLYALVVDGTVVRTEHHDSQPGPQWVPSPDTKLQAEPGFQYDPQLDEFITPKPYPSWTYNKEQRYWQAPVQPRPRTEWPEVARWDETGQQWQIINLEQPQ